MLFDDLLSLHLVTFLMFFIIVYVTFSLAADACLSWSLPSITEQQVCPHRLPMQYCLKNNSPDQALFKHSQHANCTSDSTIMRNSYNSLLSDLCACVHVKKKWHHKGSHSSSVSGSNHLVWLWTWKKWWAGALLSEKCCCFVRKPSWKIHTNLN